MREVSPDTQLSPARGGTAICIPVHGAPGKLAECLRALVNAVFNRAAPSIAEEL